MEVEAFQRLKEQLQQNQIKSFKFGSSGESFTPSQWDEFCNLLATNQSLEKLTLYGFSSNYDLTKLASAIQKNKSLQTLELISFSFKEKDAEAFSDLLRNTSTLRSLMLTSCSFNNTMQKLTDALGVNTSLTTFEISNTKLLLKELSEIASALNKNRHLQALILSTVRMSDNGLQIILDGIRNHLSLDSLNLSSNRITDIGAKNIADVLKLNNPVFQGTLVLEENRIGDKGAEELASAIAVNTALAGLNLQDNPVGDVGLIAFARALRQNTSLNALILNNDSINTEGNKAISVVCETRQTPLISGPDREQRGKMLYYGQSERKDIPVAQHNLHTSTADISEILQIPLNQVEQHEKTTSEDDSPTENKHVEMELTEDEQNKIPQLFVDKDDALSYFKNNALQYSNKVNNFLKIMQERAANSQLTITEKEFRSQLDEEHITHRFGR